MQKVVFAVSEKSISIAKSRVVLKNYYDGYTTVQNN